MSAGTVSYRSALPAGRDRFSQLLHAEWTKFRTVRGWTITAVAAALSIVLFAYLGTFRRQDGGICVGPNPATATCTSFVHPTPARAGRRGGLRHLFLRAPHAGRRRQHHRPRQRAERTRPGQQRPLGECGGPGRRGRLAATVGEGRPDPHPHDQGRLGPPRAADAQRQAGLFVTSPPTAPAEQAPVPGAGGAATGTTATFDRPDLTGGWSAGGWAADSVGAAVDHAVLPVLSSASCSSPASTARCA
ncbi:MAG: hypothetical protein ABSH51_10165 [Solirubrobacteraceae bacterium]|jgi:hypothetical protein